MMYRTLHKYYIVSDLKRMLQLLTMCVRCGAAVWGGTLHSRSNSEITINESSQ